MKEVFGRRYGVQQIRIASNAACMELKQVDRLPAQKFSLRTVGYLSNLSFEKGLADVFAVARRMPGTQFHIAGPFQDKAVEGYFRDAAAGLQNIKYVGPVFGDAKRDFYAGLDAFVFPTKYKNEAEPLVILEALMYGCPVVANNRGCIGGLLADGVGALVMNADAFAIEASEVLQSWSADSTLYAQLSQAARLHFNGLFAQARKAQGSLLDEILAIKSNDVE
jgi:glycosyltransferase involved in cell wall biosynthesis